MPINLFSHNEQAYQSAVTMLNGTGKAAIIHPTGTGKSFIGFKLCEEHVGERVCWLSPSEYIYKTQLENLKAAFGYEPDNIVFYTYAKLMLMPQEQIDAIRPDYIVLDEFHRCGAQMWGQGVQKLLQANPDVPVLGLSATHIRYLDNHRDMANELFDGNIASEMTLGEAIVRGILHPPKYVLSLFQYGESLKKYEDRVSRTRSKPVRDKAQLLLEELRRTLEKADGLDELFHKHMKERTGKYIVFCANKEHMDEMMQHTEWFAKVDQAPRIYSVYTPEAESVKAFEDFRLDEDDSHLRLLYCIDALNEGIHVEGVSGVILLRPTVSPIIYKQQIGRALSAGKKNDVVIFDIVLNIENLYSIDATLEEMEIATSYYRMLGESEEIVHERFTVIDEVRDCRELFDRLNDTLSASWDMYYRQARMYYDEHGNLEIPARYITADGYALGRWLFNQKGVRNGTIPGRLTQEQIRKLDEIGMIWEYHSDINWEKHYNAASEYYLAHGDLNVPAGYVTTDGVLLGRWLGSLRVWEKAGVHAQYLTRARKEALNEIGMVWSVLDYYWEKNYMAAVEYYREHGHLDMPSAYVSPEGIRLGTWICRLRRLRAGLAKGTPPTAEQIRRLDAIGMVWGSRADSKWEKGYAASCEYVRRNGNLVVPGGYVTEEGLRLRIWIDRQRMLYRKGTIPADRKRRLDEIGMVWRYDTGKGRRVEA